MVDRTRLLEENMEPTKKMLESKRTCSFFSRCYGWYDHRRRVFRRDGHMVGRLHRYGSCDKWDDHKHALDCIGSCTKAMECRKESGVEEPFDRIGRSIRHN